MMGNAHNILFFNWDKLVLKSSGHTHKIKSLFEKIIFDKDLRKQYDGYSFLLNPEPLLDRNLDIVNVVEYIGIAALRNYFDYKYRKDASLPIYFTQVPIDKIKSNRLLRLEKDEIKFKFEEQLNGY